jgi:hypothetical protein
MTCEARTKCSSTALNCLHYDHQLAPSKRPNAGRLLAKRNSVRGHPPPIIAKGEQEPDTWIIQCRRKAEGGREGSGFAHFGLWVVQNTAEAKRSDRAAANRQSLFLRAVMSNEKDGKDRRAGRMRKAGSKDGLFLEITLKGSYYMYAVYSICVCTHVCVCICMYCDLCSMCMCACACACAYACTEYTRMCMCTCMCMCVCMHWVHTYVYVHKHVHVCMHALSTHVCACACACACIE